jgi:hypothetical protein
MLSRIDVIVAAGQYGDRAARQARPMRRGADATGEPRHDGKARVAEFAGDPLGELRASR